MSKRCEVTITCPKCNEEHPFVMWQSINTQLDPEMRAAVKDRSAFQFICPTCGEKTYVDYGFLYHQMEDGIMIMRYLAQFLYRLYRTQFIVHHHD